jgi:hypothetical protein
MRVAVALTGMASLAAGGILVAEPAAHAGTNGQKVEVCGIPRYGSVSMVGFNQNGSRTETGPRHLGDTSCWEFTNYWWKGRLNIVDYSSGGYPINPYQSMKTSIPKSLQLTNWEVCYMSIGRCLPG